MPSFQIAIIIETMNSYGQGIIRGICNYLRDAPEKHTIFYEERTLDSSPPSWLKSWKGDGVIVRDRSGKSCRLALKTGAKIVDLSEKRKPNLPTIYSDHAACSQLAAEHLKSCGFDNFAFVGIKGRPFSDKRRDAFFKEVENAHHYELNDNERAIASWGADNSALAKWLKHLPKPIGIMACYDLVGIRILQACNLSGIQVPGSVAVIGVNNDEIQCTMANPSMSSVAQNPERIGYGACSLLFQLMQGQSSPNSPLLIPPLGVIARESTDILVVPDQLVSRAIQIIRRDVCEGITIQKILDMLNVNRRTLERRFFKSTGATLHDEIINAKIKAASEFLISTRMTIKTVAKKVGFHSISHFVGLFEEKTGEKPTAFRKERANTTLVKKRKDEN